MRQVSLMKKHVTLRGFSSFDGLTTCNMGCFVNTGSLLIHNAVSSRETGDVNRILGRAMKMRQHTPIVRSSGVVRCTEPQRGVFRVTVFSL